MSLWSLLNNWLEKREGSKFRVNDDLTWPGAIMPGDGFRGLRGTFDDSESARLPAGGPRIGSDGSIKFFSQDE